MKVVHNERVFTRRPTRHSIQLNSIYSSTNTDTEYVYTLSFGFRSLYQRPEDVVTLPVSDHNSNTRDLGSSPEPGVEHLSAHVPDSFVCGCAVAIGFLHPSDSTRQTIFCLILVEQKLKLNFMVECDKANLSKVRSYLEHVSHIGHKAELSVKVRVPHGVGAVQKEHHISRGVAAEASFCSICQNHL